MTRCDFCTLPVEYATARDDLDQLTLCDPCWNTKCGFAGDIALWLRVHVSGEWLSSDVPVNALAIRLSRLAAGTLRAPRYQAMSVSGSTVELDR